VSRSKHSAAPNSGHVTLDCARRCNVTDTPSLRKIDLWILPAFSITQGLAFLDKTALNYGNLFGMKAGLGVTTAQFVSGLELALE
jgi:hypothetical protein